MAKAIDARRKGDEYQARVFWLNLLKLRTGDPVGSVTFESDEVPFLDDIVISYREPQLNVNTRKLEIVREYIQCKYHVTQSGALDHDNLIDPGFIHCKSSMLKRLHVAYERLSLDLGPGAFRLCIFTNWHWDYRDPPAKHLHEEAFRCSFYDHGPTSEVGKVLTKWADHLCISQEDLRRFLKTIRFDLGKNLVDLERELTRELRLAELETIDPTVSYNIYDDLAWKLFGKGRTTFTRDSFNSMIREEKLLLPPSEEISEISIQSFSLFARRPHDIQERHLDLRQFFDRRLAKSEGHWHKEIPEQVSNFLLDESLGELPQPIHFFLRLSLEHRVLGRAPDKSQIQD